MALIRCVNTNFSFVLNSSYCKCIKNIKRLITNNRYKTEDNYSIPVVTFKHMINFREQQARKSILVNIGNEKHYNEFLNMCTKYVKILNVYHYFTKNNMRYALVELNTSNEVQLIKTISIRNIAKQDIYIKSNILLYKNANMSLITKQEQNTSRRIEKALEFKNILGKHTSVSMQMVNLYNSLKITDLDIRLRFFIAQQILVYLRKLFYNLNVIPFGSSVNGFGQMGCDLDLLCTPPENYFTSDHSKLQFMTVPIDTRNELKQKQFLEAIGTIMDSCIPEIGNVRKILRARVPIIKFSYLATDTECDLSSSNNKNAIDMSKAFYTYGLIDWRIKPLVCTIRTWAKNMNITKENPGTWITNYSLTMLVLFYLQVENILPSLNTVESNEEQIIAKYKIDLVYNKLTVNKTTYNDEGKSLDKLLCGFFQYYNSFNFAKYAICIREANVKTKLNESPLYIYNPYNHNLNVSKNISQSDLNYMKNHITKAFQLLSKDNCSITNLLGLSEIETSAYKLVQRNDNVYTQKNGSNNKKQTNDKFVDKKLVANETDVITLRAKENM